MHLLAYHLRLWFLVIVAINHVSAVKLLTFAWMSGAYAFTS
jgi:hypothetical protein